MEKIDICRHFFYQSLYLHWISQRSDCTLSASLKRKGHFAAGHLDADPGTTQEREGKLLLTHNFQTALTGNDPKSGERCLTSTTSRDMWLYLKWGIYIQYGQFHLFLSGI